MAQVEVDFKGSMTFTVSDSDYKNIKDTMKNDPKSALEILHELVSIEVDEMVDNSLLDDIRVL